MSKLRYWLLFLPLLAASSGCLITQSTKRVIREDESRHQVQFESPEGAAAFTAQASNNASREASGTSASFGIPFLIGIFYSAAPSQNAYYNDQVSLCDANGDCFLTDAEVSAFTGQRIETHFSYSDTPVEATPVQYDINDQDQP